MAKKKNLHKRYKHEGGFIGLPTRVFDSAAYRDLSLKARCLLDELQKVHRSGLNGRIVFSIDMAAQRLNVTPKTASSAFQELIDHGLIERMLDGNWLNGQAREWRLTYEIYKGREPTDEWKGWRAEN